MQIRITILTDNDAFQPDPEPEIKRIMTDVVKDLYTRPLRDINGNTVGSVTVNTDGD